MRISTKSNSRERMSSAAPRAASATSTAGAARATRLLQQTWQEQKLARDLPMLTRVQTEELSEKVRSMIDEEMALARTGWFATHPAEIDRQRAADAIGGDGFL